MNCARHSVVRGQPRTPAVGVNVKTCDVAFANARCALAVCILFAEMRNQASRIVDKDALTLTWIARDAFRMRIRKAHRKRPIRTEQDMIWPENLARMLERRRIVRNAICV